MVIMRSMACETLFHSDRYLYKLPRYVKIQKRLVILCAFIRIDILIIRFECGKVGT